tara:strand:- start:82 stop:750 length:669 start_codon:yes stop_codon:yes gene_type:complete
MIKKVAALYVQTNGTYFNLPKVDPWDEDRDARTYDGPLPVIAHPPCQRWGKMWAGSPSVIANTGVRKKKGDDDGCFMHALGAVRKWGGVLEHPWGSHAWEHFQLNKPDRKGGWIAADSQGGWTCCVEQGRYGHYAPKPTMLYSVRCELPKLDWGVYKVQDSDFPAWALKKYGRKRCRRIGLLSFKGGGKNSTPRIHTPEPFRELLIEMASSVKTQDNSNSSP